MPVKWTADKDSFILNHLLIDTRIKIDNAVIDSMIETWRMYPRLYSMTPHLLTINTLLPLLITRIYFISIFTHHSHSPFPSTILPTPITFIFFPFTLSRQS